MSIRNSTLALTLAVALACFGASGPMQLMKRSPYRNSMPRVDSA
jgi:hypothetical protein